MEGSIALGKEAAMPACAAVTALPSRKLRRSSFINLVSLFELRRRPELLRGSCAPIEDAG